MTSCLPSHYSTSEKGSVLKGKNLLPIQLSDLDIPREK